MATDTELKLKDAGTQMKIALDNIENEDIFRSCVNSFIANSRSVTMLMEKESSNNIAAKKWYKNKMKDLGMTPLFKYFNKQRVHTIHRGVIKPVKNSHKAKTMTVKFDTVSEKHSANVTLPPSDKEIPIGVNDVINLTEDGYAWGWYFTDMKGQIPNSTGNVPDLCEQYFIQLKSLVIEWLQLKQS